MCTSNYCHQHFNSIQATHLFCERLIILYDTLTGNIRAVYFYCQVECELFPDMRSKKLLLRTVKIEEALVVEYVDKAMDIFKHNTVGPQK